jgi:uncharacterized RDD family membrane protein YckC
MAEQPTINDPSAAVVQPKPPPAVPVPVAPAALTPVNVTVNAGGAPVGTISQLPQGVYLASVGKRIVGYLLDIALIFITFGLGWLVWAAVVAAKGQTPGRQLLGMRVVAIRDGRPLSWASMVFLRGLIGGFVASMAFFFTLGILAFMPLWDRNNQSVIDKVSASLVIDDPHRVYQ